MKGFLLLFLAFASINCEKKCKIYPVAINEFSPKMVEIVESQLFNVPWDNNKVELSEDGKKLENVFRKMFNGDDEKQRVTALLATQWIHTYLGLNENKPNMCPYAKMINATVDFKSEENCPQLENALDSILVGMKEGTNLALAIGVKSSNCEYTDDQINLSVSDEKCHSNGEVYDVNEMLENEASDYPAEFKSAVLNLYSSESYNDKLMALFATVSLSKHFVVLERKFDTRYKYLIASRVNGFPDACCNEFINTGLQMRNMTDKESERVVKVAKQRAGCSHKK